jgi:hypothetical protein
MHHEDTSILFLNLTGILGDRRCQIVGLRLLLGTTTPWLSCGVWASPGGTLEVCLHLIDYSTFRIWGPVAVFSVFLGLLWSLEGILGLMETSPLSTVPRGQG